jgi:hypothetical protein
MTASHLIELDPPDLLCGTPEIADRYLVWALFGESEAYLFAWYVLHWADIVQARGDDFASHAAACHYWLYEHCRGYEYSSPKNAIENPLYYGRISTTDGQTTASQYEDARSHGVGDTDFS